MTERETTVATNTTPRCEIVWLLVGHLNVARGGVWVPPFARWYKVVRPANRRHPAKAIIDLLLWWCHVRVSDRWKQRVTLNDLFEAYHASILENKRQFTGTGDGWVPHTTGVLGSLLLSPGVLPGWNWARSATWASIPWHQNLLFEGGLRPTDDIIANFELFRERVGLRLFNLQLHLLLSALVLIVQILLD